MPLQRFHALLYGVMPLANVFRMHHRNADEWRTIFGDNSVNDVDNDDDANNNSSTDSTCVQTIRDTRYALQRLHSLVDGLAADEQRIVERRALLALRTRPYVANWQTRLQLLESELDGETMASSQLRAARLCYDGAVLRCQLNQHQYVTQLVMDALHGRMNDLRCATERLRVWLPDGEPHPMAMSELIEQGTLEFESRLQALDVDQRNVVSRLAHIEATVAAHACLANRHAIDDRVGQTIVTRTAEQLRRRQIVLEHLQQQGLSSRMTEIVQKLAAVDDQLTEQRQRCDAEQQRIAQLAQDCQRHLVNGHRERMEYVRDVHNDVYHPTMRAVFALDTLIGAAALQRVLGEHDEVAADFVGYVLDFVRVRTPHDRLVAARVQSALGDVLLNGIFKTGDVMRRCCRLMPVGAFVQMWSLDTVRPTNVAPIGVGHPFQRLGDVLHASDGDDGDAGDDDNAAVAGQLVASLIERYVLLHSDEHDLGDAAGALDRHVICARTGRWTSNGCPYVAWPMAAPNDANDDNDDAEDDEQPPASVFDYWRADAMHDERREHLALRKQIADAHQSNLVLSLHGLTIELHRLERLR